MLAVRLDPDLEARLTAVAKRFFALLYLFLLFAAMAVDRALV